MKENTHNKEEWICTDIDNNQFGRKIKDGVYEFKENGSLGQINLSTYTHKEKEEILSSYGYIFKDGKFIDCCGDIVTDWIIAECIFEYGQSGG